LFFDQVSFALPVAEAYVTDVPVGASGLTLSTVAEVRGGYVNLTFAVPVQLT